MEEDMPKATWNGVTLAESEETVVVDGKHYFPPDRVNREYLGESSTRSVCPWKGTAVYFHVHVDGEVNSDAAWTYPEPKAASRNVQNYVAFWKGVAIEEE
jgi:uncharacterized protein (DUF427 family)